MFGQQRQILLLLDNCTTHLLNIKGLRSVRVAFFPPNSTSTLQPCDQGIIRNFKMNYRSRLLKRYLIAYEGGSVPIIDLKQSVDLVSAAWNDVLPSTIENCWHHSGIIKADVHPILSEIEVAVEE